MIPLNFRPFNDIDKDIYNALNNSQIYSRIDITKAQYDEIHVLENPNISSGNTKMTWQFDTVLLAEFKNSLEAGNLSLNGMQIDNIKIRKKKKEDLRFEDVKIIPFQSNNFHYEFEDVFIESLQDYVYALQPMGGSPQKSIHGSLTTSEVYSDFENVWIVGFNEQYELLCNLEVGDYERIIPTDIIETIGNKYPYLISNGNVNYRKGNIRAMLISKATLDNNKGIDRKEEKKLRQAIMNFLTDRKPKFFKDGSGENMLISIVNAPTVTPMNNIGQQLYNISIDFVEVGSVDVQSLINTGLVVL